MSWDIAVWEGEQPESDAAAAARFDALYAWSVDADDPPTPALVAYVDALLARYPDLTDVDADAVDESPWADGPLIDNAIGPLLYFALVSSKLDAALPFIVETARERELVCFDPQTGELLGRERERRTRRWWRRR